MFRSVSPLLNDGEYTLSSTKSKSIKGKALVSDDLGGTEAHSDDDGIEPAARLRYFPAHIRHHIPHWGVREEAVGGQRAAALQSRSCGHSLLDELVLGMDVWGI